MSRRLPTPKEPPAPNGTVALPTAPPLRARQPLPPRRRLPWLLRRAWYGLNQAFRHRAAPLGLTPDQYTVLRILLEAGSARLTQGELAGAMSSDANTIASLLRRMEKQGWLERRPHPRDRRARCLVLKEEGRRKCLQTRRVALALQATILEVLPKEGQERFLAQLERVACACWQAAGRAE